MKQKILLGLAGFGLAFTVAAQPLPLWETPGSGYFVPNPSDPSSQTIDALAFHNPQGVTFSVTDTARYGFSDTLNFTNQGYMYGSPGFEFETKSLDDSVNPHPAAWFVNQGGGPNGGILDVTGFSFAQIVGFNVPVFSLTGNGGLFINATNIVNSGDIFMGSSSLIRLVGDNVDLSEGAIIMTNPVQSFGFFSSGMLDNYWGTGKQPFGGNPRFDFGGTGVMPTFSPFHPVTNRLYQTVYQSVAVPNAVAYAAQFQVDAANLLTQVVFLSNTNSAFTNNVFFDPFEIGVQWNWVTTNWPSQSLTTNSLFLTDTFGEQTNVQVVVNGTVGTLPTYIPINYSFFRNVNFGGTPATPITAATLTQVGFPNQQQTNVYAAYQAIFAPGTSLPNDVVGGDLTNTAGRIEITANSSLNLTDAQISSLNYLLLKSPNQYLGNQGAQILTPYADLVLGSTNGLLALTNLMAPYVAYPAGTISLFSSRMTNVDTVAGVTNTIHVLFVNSSIAPTTLPLVHDLELSAQNITISDILNLSSNASIHAQSLTITTNAPDNAVASGQINLVNPYILWPTDTPGLQFMTNWGQFTSINSVFFGGSHYQPAYDPNGINVPYETFVNHGLVSVVGAYIWAHYFEDTGTIDGGLGPIQLQQGFSVRLHDGALYATNSDISLTASDLVVSNQVIQAGGALTLAVTNYLDDGSYLLNSSASVTNKNVWVADNGLNLPVLPQYSSLLATTVQCTNVNRQSIVIRWAGADRGPNPAGFYNNAALGHLVLVGQDPSSSVTFLPINGNNALYVDTLEIAGTLTRTDDTNNLVGFTIPAGMTVYYGQALLNGNDYSLKLNGKQGFVWVGSYKTTTPPANPTPVYPPLVLTVGVWTNSTAGSGGGTPTPPTDTGKSKLDLPSSTRAGGPASGFVAASYSGLFADTNGIGATSSGSFTVRTTAQGRFTGKVYYAGQTYSFSGKLTRSNDVATATISQGGLTISFWLVSADAAQLQGQVSGAGWSANLVAFRQATSKSVPAAGTLRGTYTLLIPPVAGGPEGYGFGSLKADASGNVRWAGTLADGTKVTQGSVFSSAGNWGLYASLYGGRGAALGWLQLSTGNGTNLNGQCLWVKPAGLGSRYFPQGFTNDVQVLGSAYVRRSSQAVLALNNGAGTLTLSGGGLAATISQSLVLDRHNHVTSSDSPAPSVQFNPTTGLFSGSLWFSPAGKISFQGAVFQNGDFAAGNFLGTTQSGTVLLSPAP